MPLIPIIDEAKVKKFKDEPKFGTVVDNNDPEKLCRVKVEIPGLFEGDASTLPWIRRKTDTAFCGQDCEIFDVPEEGSIVEVKWNYDENTPMYSGAPYNKKHRTGAFLDNYPNEAGIKFGPHLIKFDKKSYTMTIENGQCQIILDMFGDCCVACNSLEVKCDQDALIKAPEITLDGNVQVTKGLKCANGANGTISLASIAGVSGGIIESIE